MKNLFDTNNETTDLEVSKFDHKEPKDNDCGLPENPIFSNYSKYLWKSHVRSGGVQTGKRLRKMDN